MEGKKVVVYSTPTCPWCHRLKDYLGKRGVKYEDIDVSGNIEAARDMIRKSGQMGVPQIEIGDKIIIGFDVDAIEKALAA